MVSSSMTPGWFLGDDPVTAQEACHTAPKSASPPQGRSRDAGEPALRNPSDP